MKKWFILLFVTFLMSPLLVFAQLEDAAEFIQGGISTSFVLNPQTPGPNEKVNINLESYEVNLDNALITWVVDENTVKSGKGEKNLTIYNGNVGTSKTIKVTIVGDGKNFSKSMTISAGEVDLIWQGHGYTLPFYKGKNLWTSQGFVTVVAIPNLASTNNISTNNLVYRWSQNDDILGNSSGRGKNHLTFADSILGFTQNITVEVFNENDLIASKTITINPGSPKALVYENNPLLGYMFNYESNSGYVLTKPEVTFTTFPLFFSANSKNDSNLSINWSSNQTSNLEKGSEIVFRIPEDKQGQAYIRSNIKSNSQLLQGASKEFLVQFGKENAF